MSAGPGSDARPPARERVMAEVGALRNVREAMTGLTVFGEPIQHDRVVVIPASRVFGGGGGGAGEQAGDLGQGGGFGGFAIPAGALVISDDGAVSWRPAYDPLARVVAGATIVAGLLGWRALSRRRR